MGLPTHSPSCRTWSYKTACPDCKKPVFFFSCNCGSRIFFDLLGPPWPEHRDVCIPYLIKYLSDIERVPKSLIKNRVINYAQEHDLEIPPESLRALRHEVGRNGSQILAILPGEEEIQVLANVVEKNDRVNLLKRSGFSDTSISRTMLGDFCKNEYAEVTLRQEADAETGFVNQFSAVIPTKLLVAVGLRTGRKVGCTLTPRRMGSFAVWEITSLESLKA